MLNVFPQELVVFSKIGLSIFEFIITVEMQTVYIDFCKSKIKCLVAPYSILETHSVAQFTIFFIR